MQFGPNNLWIKPQAVSEYITWMCSTSAKCDSQFLYMSFPEDVKVIFSVRFLHDVVFVVLFEGLSPASLLHQLKSTDCYHSSECLMDFVFWKCTKYHIFEFCKVSSKYLLLSDRWRSALVHLWYENAYVPDYRMAKAKYINGAVVHWLQTQRSPSSMRMRLYFSSPVFLATARPLCLKYWLYRFSAVNSEWYSSLRSA